MINKRVVGVVRDGLERGVNDIIEHALSQWMSGSYGLDKELAEQSVKCWRNVRREADEIVSHLKDVLREIRKRGTV